MLPPKTTNVWAVPCVPAWSCREPVVYLRSLLLEHRLCRDDPALIFNVILKVSSWVQNQDHIYILPRSYQ